MSAPPPLYHGTRAPFRRGGYLFPATFTGTESRYAPGVVEEHVYLTPHREVAEHFARKARGRGRPRLLTVLPLGPLEDDPHLPDAEAYRCRDGAKVLAVEVIPEVEPEEAEQ